MKKLLAFCLALALLCLGGCSGAEEDKTSSVSEEPITITVPDNLYEPDFFTGLYQKIGDKLGAGDEDFIDFSEQRFFFSTDGTLQQINSNIYCKIPKLTNPQNIYTDYSYIAYNLTLDPTHPTEVVFYPTGINFAPDKGISNGHYNYSKFRERSTFLTEIHLKDLVKKYAVGKPTGFALCYQTISENFEDDFTENGIFLDCTDPSNIKQIDRMAFSDTSPYSRVFDGVKFYYGIYPYYQEDLTGEEMQHLFFENTDWDNIIILIVRK